MPQGNLDDVVDSLSMADGIFAISPDAAKSYYRDAVILLEGQELGHEPEAKGFLALLYKDGHYVDEHNHYQRNIKQAVSLLEDAHKGEDPESSYTLGRMYDGREPGISAEDIPRSAERALECYMAAMANDTEKLFEKNILKEVNQRIPELIKEVGARSAASATRANVSAPPRGQMKVDVTEKTSLLSAARGGASGKTLSGRTF